ncbi:MAG: cytochrome c-type biogenesis protein CcmH [Pseudomonadota bacterium]|nr:cytochrome c-type biogenesis protein CcmH [Pseudomonadota bacterium]
MKMTKVLVLGLLLCLPLQAQQPSTAPELPLTFEQNERYQVLVTELRCLVCQNQTIADSNAPLASDLRNKVREQLIAGRSNAEIYDYVTERYGDFVLYRPPVRASTWLLWFGPFVLLAFGLLLAVLVARRRAAFVPRSAVADGQRLKKLLDEES